MSLLKRSHTVSSPTRSCSGCYAVLDPDWRFCRVCGMPLNAGTTHETRENCKPVAAATLLGALNLPIRSQGRGR